MKLKVKNMRLTRCQQDSIWHEMFKIDLGSYDAPPDP